MVVIKQMCGMKIIMSSYGCIFIIIIHNQLVNFVLYTFFHYTLDHIHGIYQCMPIF